MNTFTRLQSVASAADLVGSTAALYTSRFEDVAHALENNLPEAVSARLAIQYNGINTALAAIPAGSIPANLIARYEAVHQAVQALNPGPVLSTLADAFINLIAAVRQAAARPVDLSGLRQRFGAALAGAAGALPGFLFGELTPSSIRQGLEGLLPTGLIQQIEARFSAFLDSARNFAPALQTTLNNFLDQIGDKLVNISPAALIERFEEVFKPIRDAIQSLSPKAIAEELDQAFSQMIDKLGQIHPKVIREAIQPVFDTVMAKLTALKNDLIQALQQAIDAALGKLRDTLKALDPQALIVSLGNLFKVLKGALEKLNLSGLIEKLEQAFNNLRDDLTQTLGHVADAFSGMIEELPQCPV